MKSKKGFTLIELLTVIAIMAILSTIVVVQMNGSKERARDNQRKADLLKIATALEFYRTDKKSYPSVDTADATNYKTVKNSALEAALVPTYLPFMPTDPKNPDSRKYDEQYQYVSNNTGSSKSTSYTLYAVLEKATNDDKATVPPLIGTGTCPKYSTLPPTNFTNTAVVPTFAVTGNCTK